MNPYIFAGTVIILVGVVTNCVGEKKINNVNLNKDDLAEIFGVSSHDEVPDHEVVNLHEFVKHVDDPTKSDGDPCINAFKKSICLKAVSDQSKVGKQLLIEYHRANGAVDKFSKVVSDYRIGTVNNEKGSHAAFLHDGRGLTGHMQLSDHMYIVNALPHRLKSRQDDHVIYRRKVGNPAKGIEDKVRRDEKANVEANIHDVGGRMELMIVADYTMLAFYKPDILPGYLVAMTNIVNGIFHDPSLSTHLDVMLVKTVFFEKDEFQAKNINDLLSKFTDWSSKHNTLNDSNPEHYDNGVLLTRSGCKDGCGMEGLALMSLCSLKSTAVVKDRGLMTAITVAHEIGHNFGLGHNGHQNDCKKGINVMSEEPTSGASAEEWSKCSSVHIAKELASPRGWCYKEKKVNNAYRKFRLYGQEYNATRQCQFVFGSEYMRCTRLKTHCEKLFCMKKTDNSKCVAYNFPPIDGTHCAPHKWCIHGNCVPDGTTPPPPVDGNWSSWGVYVPCTRECGIGDQWRERTCTNPKPAHGGKHCPGMHKGHYRTCNTFNCKPPFEIPRLKQCKKINPSYDDFKHDSRDPCGLICGTRGRSYYYMGRVGDGAHCDPHDSVKDLCINGACRKVDCDLQLESGAVHDRCGVCNGNGTTCQYYHGNVMKPFASRGLHFVVTIPAGAQKITIKEMRANFLGFLGFKVGNSARLGISLPRLARGMVYNLDGTKIRFFSTAYNAADELIAEGRIDKPISIYFYNYYGVPSSSTGIEYKYYGPVSGSQSMPTFVWTAQEWSKCSLSCGGGVQKRKLNCIRTDDDSLVNRKACSNSKEIPSERTCNEHDCPAIWFVTAWSKCSKTCGSGTQTRQILCSVTTINGRKTVADEKCTMEKSLSPTVRHCNQIMCAAKWHIASDFGDCSKICGGGIKKREVVCQHISKDGTVKTTSPVECIKLKKPDTYEDCNKQPCLLSS